MLRNYRDEGPKSGNQKAAYGLRGSHAAWAAGFGALSVTACASFRHEQQAKCEDAVELTGRRNEYDAGAHT